MSNVVNLADFKREEKAIEEMESAYTDEYWLKFENWINTEERLSYANRGTRIKEAIMRCEAKPTDEIKKWIEHFMDYPGVREDMEEMKIINEERKKPRNERRYLPRRAHARNLLPDFKISFLNSLLEL